MEVSLRDYFAAHCPDSELLLSGISSREDRCRQRYAWADMMLAARGKPTAPPAPPAPTAKGPDVTVGGKQ